MGYDGHDGYNSYDGYRSDRSRKKLHESERKKESASKVILRGLNRVIHRRSGVRLAGRRHNRDGYQRQ